MKNEERIININVARGLWNSSNEDGKIALERLLGKHELTNRPIGMFCLGVDNTAKTIDKWGGRVAPLGVGIITEDRAIIVAPHASAAL